MAPAPGHRPAKIPRTPPDKFAERRDELAAAALRTLAERGYAHTSLRDIAENSAFSHGVVHYYFRDKPELIIHGLELFRRLLIATYDEGGLDAAGTPERVAEHWAGQVAAALRQEPRLYAVWYDLRVQCAFEPAYVPAMHDIDTMIQAGIGRICERYAELSGRTLRVDAATAYALFDGLFEKAVMAAVAGDEGATDLLEQRFRELLPTLLA